MHTRYAKDGLVAISVALTTDDTVGTDEYNRIAKFLNKSNATIRNFVLDEPGELWQKKLGINGPPCIYLFDKDNRFVKKMVEDDVDFAVLEKTIRELLKP